MTRLENEALAHAFLARLFDDQGPLPAVDWEHYRLMQLIPGTAGVADPAMRDQLVGRGFVELAKGEFDADTERRSVTSLRVLITQVLGEQLRIVPGFDNPMVRALASGPTGGAPPNLHRLLSAVSEVVSRAVAVTICAEDDLVGERLMTLLFVDGKYVGFLPAARTLGSPVGAAS
jgi:hypothetical protein